MFRKLFSEKNLLRATTGLVFLTLVTPLLVYKKFINPFIILRISVFQILIELLVALYIGLILFYPRYRPRFSILHAALGIFLAIITIASIFGIDPHRSFWSTPDRAIGLFALFHFAAFFVVIAALRERIAWRKIFLASFGASVVNALMTLLLFTGIVPKNLLFEGDYLRPGAFFGNPAFAAVFMLFHVFIGAYLFATNVKTGRWGLVPRLLLGTGIVLNVIAIFLSQTRATILGLGVGGVIFLLWYAVRRDEGDTSFVKKMRVAARGTLILGFAVLFLFAATRSWVVWQKIPGLGRIAATAPSSLSEQPRFIAWGIALKAIAARPALGYGLENFKYPFDAYYEPALFRQSFSETYFDKPHNVVLEYGVTAGIPGLLAYLGLIGALVFSLVRQHRDPSARLFFVPAIAAYFVQNVFIFDTFGSYLMLMLLCGYAAGLSGGGAAEEPRPSGISRPVRGLKIAVAALSCAAALFVAFRYNVRTLYANNQQYLGMNFFVNKMPARSIQSFNAVFNTLNQYSDYQKRDFALSALEVYQQGLLKDAPDLENILHGAMRLYAESIVNHPHDYYPRVSFADMATNLADIDPAYIKLAEQQLENAFRLSPKRQQVFYVLSRLRIVQGRKKEALEVMKYALDLDPRSPDPHFYYGLLLMDNGRLEEGIAEIENAKALGRKPATPEELRVVGNYYADSGRYAEAEAFYRESLRLRSRDSETRLKLGLVYFTEKKYALAYKEIKNVLRAMPELRASPRFREILPIVEALGL